MGLWIGVCSMLDDERRFVQLLGDCSPLFLLKFIMIHFGDDARRHEKIWSGLTVSMEVDRQECYLEECHTMTILKKTVFIALYYVSLISMHHYIFKFPINA